MEERGGGGGEGCGDGWRAVTRYQGSMVEMAGWRTDGEVREGRAADREKDSCLSFIEIGGSRGTGACPRLHHNLSRLAKHSPDIVKPRLGLQPFDVGRSV